MDTGWINDENPREKAVEIHEKHNFQTPIDEVDAAARIIFTGCRGFARRPAPRRFAAFPAESFHGLHLRSRIFGACIAVEIEHWPATTSLLLATSARYLFMLDAVEWRVPFPRFL